MKIIEAKKIACVITHEKLNQMFENAKTAEINWKSCSSVNPSITKGAAWNLLYRAFLCGAKRQPGTSNMVREFGDFLPEELKPKKKASPPTIDPYHEEPVFNMNGGLSDANSTDQ